MVDSVATDSAIYSDAIVMMAVVKAPKDLTEMKQRNYSKKNITSSQDLHLEIGFQLRVIRCEYSVVNRILVFRTDRIRTLVRFKT